MCNSKSHVYDYESFAANRNFYLDSPVNLSIVTHEILRSLYRMHIIAASKNFVGSYALKVKMSEKDVFLVGTLNNNDYLIDSIVNGFVDNITRGMVERITSEEMKEVGYKAINKKDDDSIYASISNDISLIIELKTHVSEDVLVYDEVNFYINLPKNIRLT